MANFIQEFRSTDTGAATLTGQVGSLITLLNACLVNGYATAALSSLTNATSTTAVATLSSANATLKTGDYITIAGATPTAYNGTFPITVVSSTVFNYTLGSSGNANATGTLTYAKAGVGWTSPFTSTNSAVYKMGGGNQRYVQVSDNAATSAKEANVVAFETMSAFNTGTQQWPTAGQLTNGVFWTKSITADTTARAWTLIADNTTLWLQIAHGSTTSQTAIHYFGDANSYKSGDAFDTILAGNTTSGATTTLGQIGLLNLATSTPTGTVTVNTGVYVDRAYTQAGGSNTVSILPGFPIQAAAGSGTTNMPMPYPNGPDGGAYVTPLFNADVITSGGTNIRGRLRGGYGILQSSPFNLYDTITGVTGLSGVTLRVLTFGTSTVASQMAVDVTGPW